VVGKSSVLPAATGDQITNVHKNSNELLDSEDKF